MQRRIIQEERGEVGEGRGWEEGEGWCVGCLG